MTNLEWIAAGNTGCTFATMFAREPEKVGWRHMYLSEWEGRTLGDVLILSIEFPPDWNAKMVRKWANEQIFCHEENPTEDSIGLRIRFGKNVSWVQYFGPDSHVATRRTPNPMLMYTRRINPLGYYKQVGFSGILHLAHAFSAHLTDKVVEVLWKQSHLQSARKVGHDLGPHQAAKVTWLKKDVE